MVWEDGQGVLFWGKITKLQFLRFIVLEHPKLTLHDLGQSYLNNREYFMNKTEIKNIYTMRQ